MTITSSQIIEDSPQADGRRWIAEEHTDSIGKKHRVNYMAELGADILTIMAGRIAGMNESLVEQEYSWYLNLIEEGKNVVGLTYTETTQTQRAIRFLQWAKEKALSGDHQSLRYAYQIIDQFTEAQIDGLLGAGKGVKVKAWAEKIRSMKQYMDESATAAGEV